uniref:Uncharacterized protein n=1 Tax=Panagrolaimus sp. JU765 TaxID=591449 RepID=A0AC34QY33_9BILA
MNRMLNGQMFAETYPANIFTSPNHKNLEKRKVSDPVRLKAAHKEFLKKWNDEIPIFRVNPICVLRARSSAATDFEDVRKINWAFSPKRSRLNHLLIDPELLKLRQKYERKIERRRSVSLANSNFLAEKANPEKSAVVDKYEKLFSFGRRCISETALIVMSEAEIDVDLFGMKHHKRVSFSAPTVKRKSGPEHLKPTPILSKEPKKTDSDYPLSHMDYATFRAWRTGEAFRLSVDDDSGSESDEKKRPSPIQFVKYLIFSCLKR